MKRMFSLSALCALFLSLCGEIYAAEVKQWSMLTREEWLVLNGGLSPIKGKILEGRYYADKNVFSCEAQNFFQGKYVAQDLLDDNMACIAFYSFENHFKQAEIMFLRDANGFRFDTKEKLKMAFESMGLTMLDMVYKAENIEILQEEMIGDDVLFVALSSLVKMYGNPLHVTRSYLAFQKDDKLVLLANQRATVSGEDHTPKKHIEGLREDLLNFKSSFTFGPTPPPSVKKEEEALQPAPVS